LAGLVLKTDFVIEVDGAGLRKEPLTQGLGPNLRRSTAKPILQKPSHTSSTGSDPLQAKKVIFRA
jgi:hypothetical protein